MEKVRQYRRVMDISNTIYDKELWYDVGNQVFYDKLDAVFGTGIVRNGVACLR